MTVSTVESCSTPNGLSGSTSPAGSSPPSSVSSSPPPPPVAQEARVTPSGSAAAVYRPPRSTVRRSGEEMRESVIVLDALSVLAFFLQGVFTGRVGRESGALAPVVPLTGVTPDGEFGLRRRPLVRGCAHHPLQVRRDVQRWFLVPSAQPLA